MRTLTLLAPALWILFSSASPAMGDPQTEGGTQPPLIEAKGNVLVLNFDRTDGASLIDFIDEAQKILGFGFSYYPADVKDSRFTLIGAKEVNRDEFWSYFQSVLKAYDFVIVPYGQESGTEQPRFYAIRKSSGGVAANKPGYIKTAARFVPAAELEKLRNDEALIATTTFALRHVDSQDAVNMLNGYFTDPMLESVRAIRESRTITATGYGPVLYNVREMLAAIDVPPAAAANEVASISLRYAIAYDVAEAVRNAIQAQRMILPTGMPTPVCTVVADARRNCIVASGAASEVERVRAMVGVMDAEEVETIVNHVQMLQHADAKELAQTLKQWANGLPRPVVARDKDGNPVLGAEAVAITPNAATNAVIVRASGSRLDEALALIEKLDAPKKP